LYFSPSDDTETQIKNTINAAQHDVQHAVYAYTRFGISFEIDDLLNLGVWGGGITDDTANGSFAFEVLDDSSPETYYVANHSYSVHHKYLLVDANAPGLDPVVLTGSHNWSTSAQFDNDENTVIVHNASIANQYYQEWVARYKDEGGTQLPSYIVGIEESPAGYTTLIVYPNPAQEVIRIFSGHENENEWTVGIFSLSGQLMMQGKMNAENLLDVSALPEGIYLMRLQQADQFQQAKLLIQR
jgi:hypothetical protein